jgi:hypothetical protein
MKYNKQLLLLIFSFFLFGCGKSSLTNRNNSLHRLIGEDTAVSLYKRTVPSNTTLSYRSNKAVEDTIIDIVGSRFGTVILGEDDPLSIHYTPQKDFVGIDTFSFELIFPDGTLSKEEVEVNVIQ